MNTKTITKICTKCKVTKAGADFYTNKRVKSGLSGWCRQCTRINSRKCRNTVHVPGVVRSGVPLSGKTFGKLTVLHRVPSSRRGVYWACKCECGATPAILGSHLRSGSSKSCGSCLSTITTHPMYNLWRGMISRCCSPTSQRFDLYGARGISVCDRWRFGDGIKKGIECFAEDMGPKPSPIHSIDRIDNDGHYEPSNCRWATPQEQSLNRRMTVKIEVDGRSVPVAEYCRANGIKYNTMMSRIKRQEKRRAILAAQEAA